MMNRAYEQVKEKLALVHANSTLFIIPQTVQRLIKGHSQRSSLLWI